MEQYLSIQMDSKYYPMTQTFVGNSIIDLSYFYTFKQTYKSLSHPHNSFFRVMGSQKNKNFIELSLSPLRQMRSMSPQQIAQILSTNPKITPPKIDKVKQLLEAFQNSKHLYNQSDSNEIDHPTDSEREECFYKADLILQKKSSRLMKFNIFWKEEGYQTPLYLKTGISQIALNQLRMSADFFEHVHLRFGVAPYLDKYYAKNFLQINIGLLMQDMEESFNQGKKGKSSKENELNGQINMEEESLFFLKSRELQFQNLFHQERLQAEKAFESSFPQSLEDFKQNFSSKQEKNATEKGNLEEEEFLPIALGKKLVMNLSSVGAIYDPTEFETFNLGHGFYLEIHYYQNEDILRQQVSSINKNLRIKGKEQIYSKSSAEFVNKYYPLAKTWKINTNLQEVDCDIIEKILCKRPCNISSLESESTIRTTFAIEISSNLQNMSSQNQTTSSISQFYEQ